MADTGLVARLLSLWDNVAGCEDAAAAFRELYTDPVVINGSALTIDDLVARARLTADALADRSTEVLSQVVTGDATAVVFRIRARHVGPLPTPLGLITGAGDRIELQVIDVLHLQDGRIRELWMVADYLGALGATGLVQPRTEARE